VGAPWVEPESFAAGMNARELPGVRFRPALFEPTFHKHAGTPCGGCQIHVTDRAAFRPVETGVALVEAFRAASPAQFAWREPPYEYEYSKPPVDILYGSARLREGMERSITAGELVRTWPADIAPFLGIREQYLLY
jgi:uncharacterized protein YbbC (DUF1343 family)